MSKKTEISKSGSYDLDISSALEEARESFDEKLKNERLNTKKISKETEKLFKKHKEEFEEKGIEAFKEIKIKDGDIPSNAEITGKGDNSSETHNKAKDYINESRSQDKIENKGDVFSISDILKKRG